MKILLDGTIFERPAGGVARVTLGLYRACRELDPSIEIVAAHREPLRCELPEWVRPVHVGRRGSERIWRTILFPLCAVREQCDFAHFPGWGWVPKMPGRAKVILTIHDLFALVRPDFDRNSPYAREYRHRMQIGVDRSDLVITVSESTKRDITTQLRVRREPEVIYPGCDFEPVGADEPASPDRGSYFLSVRAFVPNKGLDLLLPVFLDLWKRDRVRSRLLIAGSRKVMSEEIERLLAEGRELGAVELLGWVPDDELRQLYRGARALAYPSLYEGFGLPPLEAMALGCPVITTRQASIPEVCGDAALYVDPHDARAFADALTAIDANDELRQDLIARGSPRAAGFTWRASAAKYQALLGSMLLGR